MADFSKQWCELNDPEMPSDFDILEEANKLEPNNYIPMICEGYGFIAIGKDERILLFAIMPKYIDIIYSLMLDYQNN